MGIRDKDISVSDFASTVECDWNINNNGKDLTQQELRNTGYLIAKALSIYLLKNK